MDLNGYQGFMMETAQRILTIDSPSGFTQSAVAEAQDIATQLGYPSYITNKGNLVIAMAGRETGKKIGLCAHIDTLGLMCRGIDSQGQLLFTRVGGPILPTLDGEYCKVYTRGGQVYTGTILSLSPAAHVFDDASTRKRDDQSMAVRLDEIVDSPEDVKKLGISAGDYICIDPKTTVTDSGFLKSRFIDDKGSVACILTLLKYMSDHQLKPQYATEIHLTVHEEVGHGGATISTDLDELLAVDMGCIGGDLTCNERQVSICAKDSSGPYDYQMTSRLIELAQAGGLDYAVDVYPFYSSDATVARNAGSQAKTALIGPGVHASHGMERTHWLGMRETVALLALYLQG